MIKYLPFAIGFLLILQLVIACSSSRQNSTEEELYTRCCEECRQAFGQSPVGIGAAGAKCGEFSSAEPISQFCRDYFKDHPMTVADCE